MNTNDSEHKNTEELEEEVLGYHAPGSAEHELIMLVKNFYTNPAAHNEIIKKYYGQENEHTEASNILVSAVMSMFGVELDHDNKDMMKDAVSARILVNALLDTYVG